MLHACLIETFSGFVPLPGNTEITINTLAFRNVPFPCSYQDTGLPSRGLGEARRFRYFNIQSLEREIIA